MIRLNYDCDRENLCLVVSYFTRLKLVITCSAAEASKALETLNEVPVNNILSRQQNNEKKDNKLCLLHGHQSISFIAYTNGTKLSVSCFWEQNLEIRQCYTVRHTLNFWTLLSVFKEYVTRQLKMCCRGEKGTFSDFNTDYRIHLCFLTK